ncbi:MAG: hypothetical protein FWD17_08845 [Polyangiaceae bacterium]|nr:hypothetical protein [Polyangiaceae bacterium]
MKNRRDRSQPASDIGTSAHTVDAPPSLESMSPGTQMEFVRAFADALRDILRDERARLHG